MDGGKKKVSLFKRERAEARQSAGSAQGGSTPAVPTPSIPTPAAHGHERAPAFPQASAHPSSQATGIGSDARGSEATTAKASHGDQPPAAPLVRELSRPSENGQETLEQKIDRYHKFVDENLRVRLEGVLFQRGEVVKSIEEYEKLRGSVELLSERKAKHVKTMINVGCDLYMQAAVPDTSRIMVKVGLGLYAEFTLAEALEFIAVKCERLQKRADDLSQEASEVSANIEVVLKGIQELMALPEPTMQPQRHFL